MFEYRTKSGLNNSLNNLIMVPWLCSSQGDSAKPPPKGQGTIKPALKRYKINAVGIILTNLRLRYTWPTLGTWTWTYPWPARRGSSSRSTLLPRRSRGTTTWGGSNKILKKQNLLNTECKRKVIM